MTDWGLMTEEQIEEKFQQLQAKIPSRIWYEFMGVGWLILGIIFVLWRFNILRIGLGW